MASGGGPKLMVVVVDVVRQGLVVVLCLNFNYMLRM